MKKYIFIIIVAIKKGAFRSLSTTVDQLYMCTVIHRETVSLYNNSSVWLDPQGSRNWVQKPDNSYANSRFYRTATRKLAEAKEI